jgi:REP element-mobilizing transposase RayT
MVEVTLRPVQGRFLLRPSTHVNDVIAGVLGRAQRTYLMEIHAVAFLSNHAHLLLSPDSPQQLAAFMSYVAGNVARRLGRLHSWKEKFWGRRYHACVVSGEDDAQMSRLAYVLGNCVKENLVERPQEWPGIHCARALTSGKPILGIWYDRTAAHEARRRHGECAESRFTSREEVVLSPIPCLSHLDRSAYRRVVSELIATLVADARRSRVGRGVFGKNAILQQHPHDAAAELERTPAPLIHAASNAVRVAFRAAYAEFVAAFRYAARRLKAGDRMAMFPPGAFTPPLPVAIASSG